MKKKQMLTLYTVSFKIFLVQYFCQNIGPRLISQKAGIAQILVKILEKRLPSSEKDNFIHFIQNITKNMTKSVSRTQKSAQ